MMASLQAPFCSLTSMLHREIPASPESDPIPRALPGCSPDFSPLLQSSCQVLSSSDQKKFSGDSGYICPFLTQCELHFNMQASTFTMEKSKVVYIIFHLMEKVKSAPQPNGAASQTCVRDSPPLPMLSSKFSSIVAWQRGSSSHFWTEAGRERG